MIEMMVASAIGIIAIGIIGGVFLTGQRVAKDRALELLLIQSLTSTMLVLKEDVQRAGFDGSNGLSLKLSGATDTIQLSGASAVGFAYFREGSPDSKDYRNIVYKLKDEKLKICEKGVTASDEIITFDEVTSCYSLFDEKIIDVDTFNITKKSLSSGNTHSSITDIDIEASIPSANITKSIAITVKQRNWQ